jgi:hypothetical protein
MCLVDTPGLGSVFEGNTTVTQGFVPHIDAALVVLGADPPISADELALVEKIATEIKTLLRNISASAERALGRARGRQAAPAEAVQTEISGIQRLLQETKALVPHQR